MLHSCLWFLKIYSLDTIYGQVCYYGLSRRAVLCGSGSSDTILAVVVFHPPHGAVVANMGRGTQNLSPAPVSTTVRGS